MQRLPEPAGPALDALADRRFVTELPARDQCPLPSQSRWSRWSHPARLAYEFDLPDFIVEDSSFVEDPPGLGSPKPST